MAVTKIHPIKVNLKAALDYIENPDKTDDKMLVSSFGCSYETADIEFQMLLAQAFNKGNNLAHHLIQAFEPGETTPEQAHEIGRQLADEVLQGKYPYVLTTHIDKGHLHNHIIFCAVDMVQQRKYISNRRSYAYIRRTSDRLCKENGLSVVKPGKDKGKSYAEWDAQRKGKSWKAKLKIAIDAAIPQAKDFDDFLRLMQAQGYEIKQGKFVSFRAPGQERFTRCKTLGEDYTEEAITRRIKGLAVDRGPKRKATKEITLRIDLENSIKAQQSAGYAKWAKVHNLKQAARTLNFLTEHGIDDYAALESKVAEISAANDEAAAALKAVERRLSDMAVLIKNISTYRQTRPVALEYRKAKDKAAYRREHESQLILYEAAAKAIKDARRDKAPQSGRPESRVPKAGRGKGTAVPEVRRSEKGTGRLRYHQAECGQHFAGDAPSRKDTRAMSIPRMNYRQYRKARKLTHECCNYCDGNCLLLDDGEECVCVQSISYSLLCRWFRAAVLPLDAALYAEISKSRDEVKRCAVCGAVFTPKSNRAKYCPDCAVRMRRKKEAERQRKRYLSLAARK